MGEAVKKGRGSFRMEKNYLPWAGQYNAASGTEISFVPTYWWHRLHPVWGLWQSMHSL